MKLRISLKMLLITLALSGCVDPAERAQEYLSSGKSYFKKQDYEMAKLEFKNAIQMNNQLSEAYYYLVLINEKNENWKEMYTNLNETIRLQPEHVDALLRLGRLRLLSNQIDKVLELVEKALQLEPNNNEALTMKGAVLLKQKRYDEALQLAQQASRQAPNNIDVISLQTVLLMEKKQFTEARALIESALISQPVNLDLNLLKLQVAMQSSDKDSIEADYKQLILLFPEKREFNYSLVKFYVEQGENDAAQKILQDLIKKNEQDIETKLVLIELLMKIAPQQVELQITEFIQQHPDKAAFRLALANYQIAQQQFDAAKKPLLWVIEHESEGKERVAALLLLAQLATNTSKLTEAENLIEQILTEDESHKEALILRARIAVINGHIDDGIAQLRSILRDYPDSDEALVLLANAHIQNYSFELAEQNFRKAIKINPGNYAAVMPVVNSMIKNQDYARAEDVLTTALQISSDHPKAIKALAQVRLLRKDWDGAQQIVDLVASKPGGKGYASYLQGKMFAVQGLYDKAITYQKSALKTSPGLNDALLVLQNCYDKMQQRNKMYIFLDKFIKQNPQLAYPQSLKSQMLLVDNKSQEAMKLVEKAIQQWPREAYFYELLGGEFLKQQSYQQAITIYRQGVDNLPGNYRLQIFLATAFEADKDFTQALAVYEKLVDANPNIEIAVNNLVSLLLDHFPNEENNTRALQFANRFKDSTQPYFLDTYGWALIKNNQIVEALPILKLVVNKQPDVAVFRYHLGVAHYRNQDFDAAKSELTKAKEMGLGQETFPQQEVEKLLQTLATEKAA